VITKDEEEDDEFYDDVGGGQEDEMHGGSIDHHKSNKKGNLSMDHPQGKRPKTSQGVRHSNPSLKQRPNA